MTFVVALSSVLVGPQAAVTREMAAQRQSVWSVVLDFMVVPHGLVKGIVSQVTCSLQGKFSCFTTVDGVVTTRSQAVSEQIRRSNSIFMLARRTSIELAYNLSASCTALASGVGLVHRERVEHIANGAWWRLDLERAKGGLQRVKLLDGAP